MVNVTQIKQLREATGVSISECKKALVEANGDLAAAKEILRKWGQDFAIRKAQKVAKEGIIESYIHQGKRVGVMIELHCETDFVAKSDEFKKLAHELCLQIAAIPPEEIPLLSQRWIRDETKTIKNLIDEYISRLGENIIIKRFVRYEL